MRFDIPSQAPELKPEPAPKRKRRIGAPRLHLSGMGIVIASCAVIILALAALSAYLYHQNTKLKTNNHQSSANDQAIADRVMEKVKKLYAFPNNETPTVATVKDITQLKGQAFFKSAQNGDNLLVFSKAKIALIYREKENKIINIGPVEVGQPNQSGAQNPAVTRP